MNLDYCDRPFISMYVLRSLNNILHECMQSLMGLLLRLDGDVLKLYMKKRFCWCFNFSERLLLYVFIGVLWVYWVYKRVQKWFSLWCNIYTFDLNTSELIEQSTSSTNCPYSIISNTIFFKPLTFIICISKGAGWASLCKKPKTVYKEYYLSLIQCSKVSTVCLKNMIYWTTHPKRLLEMLAGSRGSYVIEWLLIKGHGCTCMHAMKCRYSSKGKSYFVILLVLTVWNYACKGQLKFVAEYIKKK